MTEPTPSGQAIREALLDINRQIEAILASAEVAAAQIRAQAERDAERYVQERREAANQVFAAQIERLERFSQDLLSEANRALGPAPTPADPPGNGAHSRAATHAPVISREEAVLQATQMAIAKKGRSEIEAALSSELGVEESRQITEEVLGTGNTSAS